ncbi:hypothetical protein QR680_015995 [Steinernema hermaphroditum]|uniref:Uncharacterized protein n=1 Tax=Steinernema hermaphroditum TaxID=289476 RepID=A0AA39HBU9_9BILA|nr:hypothetical protein QR680_015995 [Steinernema hermaphroditum]
MRAHPLRLWAITNALQMSRVESTPESNPVRSPPDKNTLPTYNEAINDTQKYPKELILVIPPSNGESAQCSMESHLFSAQPPPAYDPTLVIRTTVPEPQSTRRRHRRRRRLQAVDLKKLAVAPIVVCIFIMIMTIIALYGVKSPSGRDDGMA